ncbi:MULTISPECIES: CsgE family curli-type amyloid fiber assembly protein [Pseudoalteromonas]|uniref:Curli production assembly/transport component CsgE n=1 Tax=Pseudoalteromonas amylolytica TaxID=1859457 RepID=A0A1S1MQB0_9GAMM|nr:MULTISPECIES: CsgE family curli-type amyloid fiber assembly protein [Pseudoalteromonas]MCF6437028.1 curli production assembly/transport protein CsgE [Pseudoalteromonas sp. MMG022]OHU85775.1 curli production assembly protein CsgE [Pseudoalteromonas sp. JW3]OHU87323.1 curli production assembly protein CsgE [Pseudoalteromonas amylolytica]
MHKIIRTLGIIISISISFGAKAVDISGFLLDQSISRSGHEFYRQLSILWRDIPATTGATVTIKETLLPKAGTVLTVELNHQVVYTTYLGRRLSPIDEQVEQAALILIKVLASNNFSKFSDDLSSSGL